NVAYNNSRYGFYLNSSSNNTLSNNTAYSNSYDGFLLISSSNNTLSNNTAYSNSYHGFYLDSSSNNTLYNNVAYNNSQHGFLLFNTTNTTLSGNDAYMNNLVGFMLDDSDFNTLINNNASSNKWGIHLYSSDYNNITNNVAYNNTGSAYSSGIYIYPSSTNNIVLNNIVYENTYGIYVWSSNSNIIKSNNASQNGNGIVLSNSASNIFEDNIVFDSSNWDINIIDSAGNVFINQTIAGDSLTTYPTIISFTYTGNVSLKGVTNPPEDPANYLNITKYVNATGTGTLFLNFSYSDAELGDVEESSLRVSRYNGTWLTNPAFFASEAGVHLLYNFVYVNINNFGSIFAPLGKNNTAPSIDLDEPANNTQINNTHTVTFTFTASDDFSTTLNCSLYLNDTLTQTNESVQNNILTPFVITGLEYGDYTWYINCSDGALNNVSETRNFSLRDTLPPVITIVNPSNNSQLPAGTTFVLVEIATNENATCEYNISGDFVLGTGSLFNETGNTTHILNFTNLTNGTTYTLYYKCNDTYGNIGGPVVHVFRVASPRRPGGGGGGGDHELYIFPINNQYSKIGETINVLFTVENTGDYSETNVRLTLTCPSSFSCGSANLGTIAEGGKKNASIPITGNSLGTFTLRVYANSEDASASREFLFIVSPECTKDSECGADERCMNSRCVEKEEVPECESDDDCDENEKCVDGRCVEIVCECGEVKNHECVPYECCSDNECFGGKVCVNNKCVEPTPPKEEGKPSEGAPSQKPAQKPPSEEAKGEEQKPPAGGGQPPANWIWILLIILGVVILGAVYFLMAKKRR
ncbi:MAG: right-handed parallel beta-helix repeat-containing protein, partial [Candidatus Anstonellales archaeon]